MSDIEVKAKYEKNPFIYDVNKNTKTGVRRISNKAGDKLMVVSGKSGEVVAPAGFWQAQEVDKTQFVKLYLNGVKAFKELTSAGAKVFEILYVYVQQNIGKDQIILSYALLDKDKFNISKATYHRGIKELIDKEFIAESYAQNLYFINPDYIWNGDRLAFVKEFRLKQSEPVAKAIGE